MPTIRADLWNTRPGWCKSTLDHRAENLFREYNLLVGNLGLFFGIRFLWACLTESYLPTPSHRCRSLSSWELIFKINWCGHHTTFTLVSTLPIWNHHTYFFLPNYFHLGLPQADLRKPKKSQKRLRLNRYSNFNQKHKVFLLAIDILSFKAQSSGT